MWDGGSLCTGQHGWQMMLTSAIWGAQEVGTVFKPGNAFIKPLIHSLIQQH